MLVINPRISIPDGELQFSYARSGGPGGQNVNKTSSKAILHWNVRDTGTLPQEVKDRLLRQQQNVINSEGEIVISAQEYRDQERNRHECLRKLSEMILKACEVPKKRKKTKPTKGAVESRLQGKRIRSEAKKQRRSRIDY